jgi:hypothetical protein
VRSDDGFAVVDASGHPGNVTAGRHRSLPGSLPEWPSTWTFGETRVVPES